MPSPHHHHHHHSTPSCCCCCGGGGCGGGSSSSPDSSSDHLLQLLATHLLIQQPTPLQYLKPQPHPHPRKDHIQAQPQPHPLINSLIRRVAALESSLSSLSHSPPPLSHSPPPLSLRDIAARTIQTAFRRFLLGRSKTLRQLKHLAAVKSHVAALKSALSDSKTHLDTKALSEKAMDLLLELDSIQSRDPMIREGKRSITRELDRMLEFIDKVLARGDEVSLGAMEIAAAATRPGRRVSFAVNGDESRVNEETVEDGISDDEKMARELGRQWHGESGIRGLSAPLPMQIEPRRGGGELKKKRVVIPPP